MSTTTGDFRMSNVFSASKKLRLDGIQNLVTGMGTESYDQSMGMQLFSRPTLNQQQQSKLLKYGFLRKLVSKLPKAATSRWGNTTIIDGKADVLTSITTALDKIKIVIPGELPITGVRKAFYHALFNAFLTGNGAIVIHTVPKKNEILDLSQPLDLGNLKQIRKLVVLDRWQIQPILNQDLEEVMFFQTLMGGASRIHSSRVLWFDGEKLDSWGRMQNQGCDESILEGIYEVFMNYAGGIQGASRMLQDFDVLDIAIKGLWEMSEDQAKVMLTRAQQNTQMQSIYRARIRDMDDESLTHSTRSVGGYSDLLETLKKWMMANTEYPPAILFGEFSSGIGASGQSQEERTLWNETIADLQESRMTHQMTGRHVDAPGLLDILCACTDGPTKGKTPEGLGWAWNPLYTPTPTEQADLETNRAQMAMTLAGGDPDFLPQYIGSAYGGNVYNPIITLTPEYKKKIADAAALVPPPTPPAPQTDEYGNPVGTQYDDDPNAAQEQQTDSDDDPIDLKVRDAVKRGLKLQPLDGVPWDGKLFPPYLKEFSEGADLPADKLNEWRTFWRDPKPNRHIDRLLHGGNWGKIWCNRP